IRGLVAMNGIPYADIIILALIAGFILLRLRSVLGQKTGNEKPDFFKRDAEESAQDKIVQVSQKPVKTMDNDDYMKNVTTENLKNNIASIKKLDGNFTATSFLAGAKMAYEMVFDAFSKGDKDTLKRLLDTPVYDTFVSAIDARKNADSHTEHTLVSVRPKEIS